MRERLAISVFYDKTTGDPLDLPRWGEIARREPIWGNRLTGIYRRNKRFGLLQRESRCHVRLANNVDALSLLDPSELISELDEVNASAVRLEPRSSSDP